MFEINLIPDIKAEVVKAQRVRNLILFVCILVVAAVVGVVFILFLIKGGQDIVMSNQNGRLDKLSAKLKSYDDLDELITLQGQLNGIDQIGQRKKIFSRVFSIIGTLLPTNADSITISELEVNLGDNTFTVQGQADAGEEPDIDYRVLEAFKKSMSVMKIDYGRFVDENDQEIPTRCIIETDDNGNMLTEGKSIYVLWTRNEKGCDPSRVEEVNTEYDEGNLSLGENLEIDMEATERIYRTPRFNEWFSNGKMTMDGEIKGIPHFKSECIKYKGIGDTGNIKWIEESNSCDLTTGDRISVKDDSSNAKNDEGRLVLKFNATIYLDEKVFSFQNKHMMAIAPSGRQNMTDSYLQLEGMFAKEAEDCDPEDETCLTNQGNIGE